MRTLTAIGGVAAAFLLFVPAALAQTTWSVDQGGGGDFLTIQDCIDAALAGDTCLVEPGTYVEHVDFLGKDLTVRGASGPESTIIDGQETLGPVVTFANGETQDAVLEGVTIRNGNSTGGGPVPQGHGVYCEGASPTVRECTITSNVTFIGGSGVYVQDGSPILDQCLISGNTASGAYSGISGGGVRLGNSSAVLRDCMIRDNTLSNYKGSSYGGGVYCTGGAPRIIDSVIRDNTVTDSGFGLVTAAGGGIACSGSDLILVNTLVKGNQLSSFGSKGAGIACYDASPTVTNSVITENDGGASVTAPEGGAIYCSGEAAAPVLTNSILWMDIAGPESGEIHLALSATISVRYSDVTGGWTGVGNIDLDPLFLGTENQHLSSSSPCIDAGDNLAPAIPDEDVDGDPRILEGDGVGKPVVDMGLDEFNPDATWAPASIASGGSDPRAEAGSRPVNGLAGLLLPFLAVLLLRGVRRRTR